MCWCWKHILCLTEAYFQDSAVDFHILGLSTDMCARQYLQRFHSKSWSRYVYGQHEDYPVSRGRCCGRWILPHICGMLRLCRELIHSALVLQPFTKLHPYKTIVWKQMCNPRAVEWMQWPSWSISKTPFVMFSILLRYHVSCHCCHSTAAIMSTLLIGVRAEDVWYVFTCAIGVSFCVSRSRHSYRQHAVASGWRRPG